MCASAWAYPDRPITLVVPESAEPGDAVTLGVDVRDEAFTPVTDAALTVPSKVTLPVLETASAPVSGLRPQTDP